MVFATFISGSMAPFLENWVAHARAAALSPLICAALDEKAASAATALGLRVVMLTTLAESAVGNGYVNIHKAAFKQMGALKVNFVRRLLAKGVHLALTDADALWLGDPRPYFSSLGLERADVLISSDCIDDAADTAGLGGHACNTVTNFNTGVLLIRATRGGRLFADAWQAKLAYGVENNISWMRDQPAFNLVAREGWGAGELGQGVGTPVVAPATLADRAAPGGGATGGQPPRALFSVGKGLHTVLGVLPPRLFGSGHSYFVQGLRQGALSVHATFQFGDDASFPFGKRMRLRQFGLWADPPSYREGRFLALADTPLTPPSAALPEDDLEHQRALLRLQFEADRGWRRRVVQGLAAARALNRTLILPAAACYCERSWAALTRCRLPAVPRMRLPFQCPFDHVVNPTLWEKSGVAFRPPNFQPPAGARRVRVRIGAPSAAEEGASPPDATLPGPLPDAQLVAKLAYWESAELLTLEGESDAVCGLSPEVAAEGHPARSAKDFRGLAEYLTDQRVFFCAEPPDYPRWVNQSSYGMVAQLCGDGEAAAAHRRGWDAFGVVRARADCPCEWGYAAAPPPPILAAGALTCG